MPDYGSYLDKLAKDYNVPPEELRAIYQLETGSGRNAGTSSAGARGQMQLMPGTARDMGVADVTDPYQNIAGGVRYYAQQRQRFGDPVLAAAAYNAGPGRVARAGGVPNIPETQNYVANFRKMIGAPATAPVTQGALSATAPKTTGTPAVDETEDDTQTDVQGGADMQSNPDVQGAPSALAALNRDAANFMAARQSDRAKQFEVARQNIARMYADPTRSDLLGALGRALLAPKPYRGFAGTLANISETLGGFTTQQKTAQLQRLQALQALQQSYDAGKSADDLKALELRYKAAAARPPASYTSTPLGKVFNRYTGYEKPQASHIKALLENPHMARDFDMKFGPGSAEEVLKLYGQGGQ